ncbi:MAG: hypothetical protein VW258_09420 [Thalassolituus sp.]
MSSVAARFQNQTVTVYDFTYDAYGDVVNTTAISEIRCEIGAGEKLVRDDTGTEFVPEFVIYTTDSAVEGMVNEKIFIGALADYAPESKLYNIRAVRKMTSLPSMGGQPDWVVYV